MSDPLCVDAERIRERVVVRCPECGCVSHRVRAYFWERSLRWFGVKIVTYRCGACRARFWYQDESRNGISSTVE